MKHILNNISENEKNEILGHYNGKLKIDNSKFNKLVESSLGDVKPIINEQSSEKPSEVIELIEEYLPKLISILITLTPFKIPWLILNYDHEETKKKLTEYKTEIDKKLKEMGVNTNQFNVDLVLNNWKTLKNKKNEITKKIQEYLLKNGIN